MYIRIRTKVHGSLWISSRTCAIIQAHIHTQTRSKIKTNGSIIPFRESWFNHHCGGKTKAIITSWKRKSCYSNTSLRSIKKEKSSTTVNIFGKKVMPAFADLAIPRTPDLISSQLSRKPPQHTTHVHPDLSLSIRLSITGLFTSPLSLSLSRCFRVNRNSRAPLENSSLSLAGGAGRHKGISDAMESRSVLLITARDDDGEGDLQGRFRELVVFLLSSL